MSIKRVNRIVGAVPCPNCGEPANARISAANHLYVTCPHPDSGGCGVQHFCRSEKADKLLARRISKWVDPNERRAFLGEEALPAKSKPKAAPEAKPAAPTPLPKPKASSWLDKEL